MRIKNKYNIQGEKALIDLTQGQVAIIDAEDLEKVGKYRWCAFYDKSYSGGGRFIAVASHIRDDGERRLLYMHRFIMNAPDELQVDHMNGDTLCNLKSNLRFANAVENARNKQGLPTNNTSGFLGVYWNKSANKWVAEIHVKGRKVHLGYFVDKMDAVRARDLAVKEHYGEFATTNKSLGLY